MNSMSFCQLWWLTQEQKLVKYRLVNWIKKQYFWANLWIFFANTYLRMNSDQEWLDKGVEFKLVDEAMIPSVVELLDESFFPDEPLFRWLFSPAKLRSF